MFTITNQLSIALILWCSCYLIYAQKGETIEWHWISGSEDVNQPGKYGKMGEPSNITTPGGRFGALGVYDSSERTLYLFGGFGLGSENMRLGT